MSSKESMGQENIRLTAENARLQAEVERLKKEINEPEWDVLVTRLEDQNTALQSELTKARELIGEWVAIAHGMAKGEMEADLMLRSGRFYAHQSAPAAKGEKDPRCCCPPPGFSGLWAAGPCPTHMGFGAAVRQVKP